MNEKQVTVLTFVLLSVMLLVGGGLGYYFYFVLLDEREKERDALAAQVADARKKEKAIPGLEEDIKQLNEDLKRLSPKIPSRDRLEYDKFANMLDQVRRDAGVRVSSASYAEARRSRPVPGRRTSRLPAKMHKVEYSVSVEGSFYQLLRYVNILEEKERFIKVQDFGIQPAGSDDTSGGAPQRSMSLTLYTFTYKQDDKPKILEEERTLGSSTAPPE